MTETENLKYIVNKILNDKEMYGGGGDSDSGSENSNSFEDSFSSVSETEEDNMSYKNYRQSLDSDEKEKSNSSESESDDETEKKKYKKKPKEETDEDNEFSDSDSEDEKDKNNYEASREKNNDFSDSDFSESISDEETPQYKASRLVVKVINDEESDYKTERIFPKSLQFVSSRIQNLDKKNEFMEQIHNKFPDLTNNGTSKSQVAVLMRYILREVNKANPDINDDEDRLFKLGEKYLDKMKEKDLDFNKFNEYDNDKKKSRNLFIQMLYKIHKINPSLSNGNPLDGNIYDTVVVRSAAFRKAKEMYPDNNLPRLEFMQKVFDIITPDFVNSVDLDTERNEYIEYRKGRRENNDNSRGRLKKGNKRPLTKRQRK